jgi:hypothetical protein
MFKKWVCSAMIMQGCCLYAGSIVENFDWGSGVPGRETFMAGGPIDGVRVLGSDVTIRDMASPDHCSFSSNSGPGRGYLVMKGLNNAIGLNYPATGTAVMKAEGKFYPGDKQVRGFWIGWQSSTPDNPLLNNQKKDHISVQFNPAGAIVFRSVIGGVTNVSAGTDGPIRFAPGDTVKLELTVNVQAKTAQIIVTGAGKDNVRSRTLNWTSDKIPDFGAAAVNQTGGGEIQLDSVEIHTEMLILG